MIKKFLSFLMIFSLIFIFACNKDEDEGPLSKEEGVEVLNSVGDDFTANFESMSESDGMVAMGSLMVLMQMDDPFGFFSTELKSTSNLATKLEDFITLRDMNSIVIVGEEPGFYDATGTYTWNPDISRWSVDATSPTDAIVIIFPTQEATPRTATLTFSDYEEVMVSDDTDEWYQPTKINVNLKLEDTEVASISYSATFDAQGEPTMLDISAVITPMEMSLNFNNNGSQIKLSTSLKIADKTVLSADLTVDYVMQEDEYGDEEMFPTKIDGFVHYGPIKLQGNVNVQKITEAMLTAQTTEDMVSAVNNNMSLAFYAYEGGGKIADIEFVVPTSQEPEMYEYVQLVFSDGSVEPLEKYLTEIMASIEQSLQEMGINLDEYDMDTGI